MFARTLSMELIRRLEKDADIKIVYAAKDALWTLNDIKVRIDLEGAIRSWREH